MLPKESGYLGVIGVSAQKVVIGGQNLAIQSQDYYMMTRERPINYLHWLAPDDTHILLEGGPVDYFIFHPDGGVEKFTLGHDVAAGLRPGRPGPRRLLEGAVVSPGGAGYALMANALSPEWTAGPCEGRRGRGVGETVCRCSAVGDAREAAGVHWAELDSRCRKGTCEIKGTNQPFLA